MKVKELIMRLLDEPMNADVMLCTDYNKEENNRGVIFGINEIEHWNNSVNINFTDWREDE